MKHSAWSEVLAILIIGSVCSLIVLLAQWAAANWLQFLTIMLFVLPTIMLLIIHWYVKGKFKRMGPGAVISLSIMVCGIMNVIARYLF